MDELEGPSFLQDVALVDLVNRVLDRGVVISGEVVVSVADVDLLYLRLSLLLSSVETIATRGTRRPPLTEPPGVGRPPDSDRVPAGGEQP